MERRNSLTAQRLIHRHLRKLVNDVVAGKISIVETHSAVNKLLTKVVLAHGYPPLGKYRSSHDCNNAYYAQIYTTGMAKRGLHITPVHCKVAKWVWCLTEGLNGVTVRTHKMHAHKKLKEGVS